jgi:RND family efflux transporter MFP subunit
MELESEQSQAELIRAESARSAADQALLQAKSSVAAMEAEVHLAEQTLRRYQDLFDKRSLSQQELDQAVARQRSVQANLEVAKARVAEAQARVEEAAASVAAAQVRLGFSRISAPFAGLIAERNVDPGTVVSPGTSLLMIEDPSSYELEVALPESHAELAETGTAAVISIPSISLRTLAKIAEVQPSAEPASRSSLVRFPLPAAPGIRSGLFGRSAFSIGTVDTLAVPDRAVLRRGQLTSVFVISDGRARRRLITTGRQSEGDVEVLSGLAESEQVVVSDPGTIADGSPVEVRP